MSGIKTYLNMKKQVCSKPLQINKFILEKPLLVSNINHQACQTEFVHGHFMNRCDSSSPRISNGFPLKVSNRKPLDILERGEIFWNILKPEWPYISYLYFLPRSNTVPGKSNILKNIFKINKWISRYLSKQT